MSEPASAVTAPMAAAARPLLLGRDRVLLMSALLIGLLLVASGLALPKGRVQAWEPFAFIACGGLLLLTAALYQLRWIAYRRATAVTVGTTVGVFLLRVVMVFVDGTFDDGKMSLFMPVYAYYTVIYLMLAILLPDARSIRYSIGAWLALALVVTVGSLSLLSSGLSRPLLFATLAYVWLGHGLFVALLHSWTREQRALVDDHARLADRERRGHQAALASEQRFRVIFEQSTGGVGLIGADRCWQIVNQRLAELTGYTIQELQGMSLMMLLQPEEREAASQRLGAFIGSERTRYSVERQWLRRDGDLIWVSLHFERAPESAAMPAAAVVMAIDISDRKLAEQQALEHQRIRDFHVDNTPLAVIEWTPEFRVRSWSRHAEQMFGWSEAEMLGKRPTDWRFVHDDDRVIADEVMRVLMRSETPHTQITIRNYHRDGHTVWCQWHTSVLRDAAGGVLSLHSMAADVSQQQEAMVALRDSEARFKALFDQMAAGIGRFSADGRWLEVNARMAELLGHPPGQLVGRPITDVMLAEDHAAFGRRLQRLLADAGADDSAEFRILHRDGHVVWLQAQMRQLSSIEGDALQGVLLAVDISERKRAEQRALEHQRVREFHFDNTPLAVIEWSPDLRVQRWSRQAEAMFGWTEAEVLGRTVDEWHFVHEDDAERIAAQVIGTLAGAASVSQSLSRNYHRDGRVVWCQWHSSVLRTAEGGLQSIHSLISDVSDEQFTIAALRDSQARFQGIFEQAAVGIAMIDAHGHWLMVNQRFREIVGYNENELLQTNCEAITDPKDRIAEAVERGRLLAGEIDDYSFEKRYRRRDGKAVWVSLYARRLDDDGVADNVRLSLVVVDITERRQAEAQVKRLNADLEKRVTERTRQLNDTVHSWVERNRELSLLTEMMGLLSAAADSGEANRIVGSYLPRLFQRYGGAVWLGDGGATGFPSVAEWGGSAPVPRLLASEDCWGLRRGQLLRIDDPAHPLLCPHLEGRADGREPHTCVPITALGQPVGLIHLGWSERIGSLVTPPDETVLSSVAEQIGLAIGNVRLREELRRQAIRDPLTGLYNRRHFDELLRGRIAEHDRSGRGFSVLMIDIDHFKRINDQHGHETGDDVLRETARRLQESVRTGEAAFRFGGEEFVLLIDDGDQLDGSRAMLCAERIRHEIADLRAEARGRSLPPITVSIGVAGYPRDVGRHVSPLQRADAALYTAKRTGRNRVCSASSVPGHEAPVGLVKLS